MERQRFKIGDKEFEFLGLTFDVALVFEGHIQEIRALLASDVDNSIDPLTIGVNEQFIEDHFQRENWRDVFRVACKVTNPQWKDKYDENGVVVGKYLEDFLTYDDFREIDPDLAESLKKNLLERLNFASIQRKPLNLQMKRLKIFMQEFQKSLKQP